MARVNIEDSFWLEVMTIVGAVGDQDKAIGNAIRFFRFAQEKHKHGFCVSEEDFKRMGFFESLIPVFAERTEAGIKAVGAEKHFGWLRFRVEAGKKGGSKRKQTEAKPSKPKQPEASPSSSPSFSKNKSGSKSSQKPAPAATAAGEDRKPIYNSAEELKAGLGGRKLAEWFAIYPDAKFLESEIATGFQLWVDTPGRTPRIRNAWITAIATHLKIAWEKRKNVAGRDALVKAMNSPPNRGAFAKAAEAYSILNCAGPEPPAKQPRSSA